MLVIAFTRPPLEKRMTISHPLARVRPQSVAAARIRPSAALPDHYFHQRLLTGARITTNSPAGAAASRKV